jgi:FSR family fosmidomycin resistance protein-like MFS transporter
VLALPLIRDELGLSYVQAGLLFTVGELSSLALEPLIGVFSDRGSKRRPVLAGAVLLAFGFGLIALAPDPVWLFLAMALIYPASGAAVGLAQATLIDISPEDAGRTMTRWTISAGIGDLLGPAVVAAVLASGFGWRPLFWLAGLLWLGLAALLWQQRFPPPEHAYSDTWRTPWQEVRGNLSAALGEPKLLRWLAVTLLASLLDEIFLSFAGLYLRDAVGLAPAAVTMTLGASLAGSMLGLLVLDRLVSRVTPARVLHWASLVVLAGLVVLLAARSGWVAAAALFVIGFSAASWYPIAKSTAYRMLPGRSGTVQALSVVLGTPVSLGAPPLIGLAAGWFGITAGLGLLALVPVLVLLLVPRGRR